MLASRHQADRDPVDPLAMPKQLRRSKPYGVKRIAQAYGLTVLAVVLGLPVPVAGLLMSNNCTLHSQECSARLLYAVIGGIVLAAVVQLVLAVHFRLGWLFWGCSALVVATSAVGLGPWRIAIGALLAPGIAAWVTDPPNRRTGGIRHWIPRLSALIVALGAMTTAGLVTGSSG